jgi:hypothetical protein
VFRPLTEYLSPDPRHAVEVLVDELTSEIRPLAFSDWYLNVSSLNLVERVPRSIVDQFDKARNTFVLSWFAFDLTTLAEVQAYLALEMALWTRLGIDPAAKKAPRLKALLTTALADGYLVQHDFFELHTYGETPAMLINMIANQRNNLSHGSEFLFGPYTAMALEICAGLIQALFKLETGKVVARDFP